MNSSHGKRRLRIWLSYCAKQKELDKEIDAGHGRSELREADFFNENRKGISKNEAQRMIQENFGQRVAYHQMILSSGDRNIDPQEFARHEMQALEEKLGHRLTWVANIHRDTGPDKMHVNVTIAGAIPGFVYVPPHVAAHAGDVIPDDKKPNQFEHADKLEEMDREGEQLTEKSELDRMADQLTKGNYISAEGARYRVESERAAKQVEGRQKQNRIAASWNERGDVYITRDALDSMRSRGNYFVHCRRNFDRELEQAIERDLAERSRELENIRNIEQTRDLGGDAVSNQVGAGDQIDRTDASTDPAHEEEKRRREDDDGFRRR